jgi:hypothetical protein
MIFVGSTACYKNGFAIRAPKDIDIWLTEGEAYFYKGLFKADIKEMPDDIMHIIPTDKGYATLDALYTIKMSHAAWDIKWEKTIFDILAMKKMGAKLLPILYHKLHAYWKTVHGDKSFLSLKKTKEEFFDDYVPHIYDHDVLHKVVAHPFPPLYETVLKDGEEVLLDKNKFFAAPLSFQISMFREEIYVIALERYIVPSDFKIRPQIAYKRALKKVITNLTKNWATQFILEHLEHFIRLEDKTWYENFKTLIGRTETMHPIIQKVHDKALEFNITDIQEFLLDDWYVGYLLKSNEVRDDSNRQFACFLDSLGFKVVAHEGGEGQGDSAFTVIELEVLFSVLIMVMLLMMVFRLMISGTGMKYKKSRKL